jgi:hypothetical protein
MVLKIKASVAEHREGLALPVHALVALGNQPNPRTGDSPRQ